MDHDSEIFNRAGEEEDSGDFVQIVYESPGLSFFLLYAMLGMIQVKFPTPHLSYQYNFIFQIVFLLVIIISSVSVGFVFQVVSTACCQ